jgi:sialidase-1
MIHRPLRTTQKAPLLGTLALTALAAAGVVSSEGAAAADAGCTSSVPFVSGTDGYGVFRIPAVLQSPDGYVLAFAEGRSSGSDTGNIDIVLKRSNDGGCTWGPLQVVSDMGANTIGNPAPVFDRHTGDVVLLSVRNSGDVHESEILRGNATPEQSRRVFVQRSTDSGETFSEPHEITSTTKLTNWRWYATTPGHAIALATGEHAGRLVVPANHSAAPPADSADTGAEAKYYGGHTLYSDDHGQTWHIGFVEDKYNGYINSNETTAAELPDGRVYFNTREHNGSSPGVRADGYSSDGGETLDGSYRPQAALDGPVVQGSVLQLDGKKSPLLFSGPRHPSSRAVMSIRASYDGGTTWTTTEDLSGLPAAYSDLVQLDKATVGILYETGADYTYATIEFRRLDVKAVSQ